MQPGENRRREQHIAAESDIGLLSDRYEAGVTRKQVPEARQRDIRIDFREQPQVVAAAPDRCRGKQHKTSGKSGRAEAARAAPLLPPSRGEPTLTLGEKAPRRNG